MHKTIFVKCILHNKTHDMQKLVNNDIFFLNTLINKQKKMRNHKKLNVENVIIYMIFTA